MRARFRQLHKKFERSNGINDVQDVNDIIENNKISGVAWEKSELVYWMMLKKRASNIKVRESIDKSYFVIMCNTETMELHGLLAAVYHTNSRGLSPPSSSPSTPGSSSTSSNLNSIQKCINFKSIKSVEIGSGNGELIIGYSGGEISLFFTNLVERDDTAWVIWMLAHEICLANVVIGESLDMIILGYSMIAQGEIFRKFPSLGNILQVSSQAGDLLNRKTVSLNEEEIEAEELLEQLDLSGGITDIAEASPVELQEMLAQQSIDLNTDIIDVLIQWEEIGLGADLDFDDHTDGADDDLSISSASTTQSSQLSKSPYLRSAYANSERHDIGQTSATGEAIRALAQTERALEVVDKWLTEQIDRLQTTRGVLNHIENESQDLERSFQNLKAVHSLLSQIVVSLSFDSYRSQQVIDLSKDLLNLPDAYAGSGGKKQIHTADAPAIATKMKAVIDPLTQLVEELCRKIMFRGIFHSNTNDVDTSNKKSSRNQNSSIDSRLNDKFVSNTDDQDAEKMALSLMDWRGLLNTQSLSRQQSDLYKIMDKLCTTLEPLGGTFFSDLLQVLHPSSGNSNNNSRHANFKLTAQALFYSSHTISNPNNSRYPTSSILSKREIQGVTFGAWNGLLTMQRETHDVVRPLFLLFQCLKEVRHDLVQRCCEAYISAMRTKFYRPFLTSIWTHLFTSNSSTSNSAISPSTPNNDIQRNNSYECKKTKSGFTAWESLELLLRCIAPVAKEEERIVSAIYSSSDLDVNGTKIDNSHSNGEYKKETNAKITAVMVDLFDVIILNTQRMLVNTDSSQSGFRMPGLQGLNKLTTNMKNMGGGGGNSGGNNQIIDLDVPDLLGMLVVVYRLREDSKPKQMEAAKDGSRARVGSGSAGKSLIHDSPDDDDDDEDGDHEMHGLYMTNLLHSLDEVLHSLLNESINRLRNAWTKESFKIDPKKSGILGHVTAFLKLIQAVVGMMYTGMTEASSCFEQLSSSLLESIESVAQINSKYSDVVRITNLCYLERHLKPIEVSIANPSNTCSTDVVQKFLLNCKKLSTTATERYIGWMIGYEFPSLASLTDRLISVSKRIRNEEITLYIRRHDVYIVVEEFDQRRVENGVKEVRKRIEKHFSSPDLDSRALRSELWTSVRDDVCHRLELLGSTLAIHYQLKLKCDHKVSSTLFEKYK